MLIGGGGGQKDALHLGSSNFFSKHLEGGEDPAVCRGIVVVDQGECFEGLMKAGGQCLPLSLVPEPPEDLLIALYA